MSINPAQKIMNQRRFRVLFTVQIAVSAPYGAEFRIGDGVATSPPMKQRLRTAINWTTARPCLDV